MSYTMYIPCIFYSIYNVKQGFVEIGIYLNQNQNILSSIIIQSEPYDV